MRLLFCALWLAACSPAPTPDCTDCTDTARDTSDTGPEDTGTDPLPDGTCPDDTYECDGTCTTLLDDVHNCGSCGYDCGSPQHGDAECIDAECALSCDAGTIYCGGDDCSPCPAHIAHATCGQDGSCAVYDCEDGYTQCGNSCLPIPTGAAQYECNATGTAVDVIRCDSDDSTFLNADGYCECPTVRSTTGSFTVATEWSAHGGVKCSGWAYHEGWIASSMFCPGAGRYLIGIPVGNEGVFTSAMTAGSSCAPYPDGYESCYPNGAMSPEDYTLEAGECVQLQARAPASYTADPGTVTFDAWRVADTNDGVKATFTRTTPANTAPATYKVNLPSELSYSYVVVKRSGYYGSGTVVKLDLTYPNGATRHYEDEFDFYAYEMTITIDRTFPGTTMTFTTSSPDKVSEVWTGNYTYTLTR